MNLRKNKNERQADVIFHHFPSSMLILTCSGQRYAAKISTLEGDFRGEGELVYDAINAALEAHSSFKREMAANAVNKRA